MTYICTFESAIDHMQPQQQDLLQVNDLHGMLHIRDSLGAESGFLQLTFIKQALQLHHKVSFCARAGAGPNCWSSCGLWMQVILLLVQETLPHYHQAIRKLVSNLNCTLVSCSSALGSGLISQFSCRT